ncbi:MAG: hypothetical protein LUO93_06140 [Methanomicrobiales archaeon]|nr:hypothetical protein [Methanomicrobiales archaeon]
MIVPAWLTLHVVGYGLAVGIIGGAGAYALHEHDAKIHAEDAAQAALDRDTLRTRLMQDALNAASAKVETVTVALKPIIQRTITLIDSARRQPTDTALVQRALNAADTSTRKCTELVQTCGDFKKMATDSLRVMGILLRQANQRALNVFAPPPAPRVSRGIQAGLGVCFDAIPPYRGVPCASVTYGFHLRIF